MGEFTEKEWEQIFSEMEANPDLYGLPEVCHIAVFQYYNRDSYEAN